MNVQSLFKWGSATVALIPGFTIILTNLGTPPGISQYLYGGIVEAIGVFTLLLFLLNDLQIKKIAQRRIIFLSTIMFFLFIISLLSYIAIFNCQIVYVREYNEKIFFPFWYQDDLAYMILNAGGKYNAIKKYGPQSIIDGINNSEFYLELTRIIFTILYLSIFEFLIIGFSLIGFKEDDTNVTP
jgi:hypothetical protein